MVKLASKMLKNLPKENLLIVDAMNLAFRWKHQKVFSFAFEFSQTVKSLAASYNCGEIIIAADMKGSSYRREIFPEYKANRKELYKNQTEQEAEEARKFFAGYEKAVESADSEFTVLRYEGVEADDIAAYLVKNRLNFGYDEIWLISSDRDWDLLVNDKVSRFSTVTRKEQTVDLWDNPVPPEMYLTYKCLIGDKGDNIPGVPGVGPKRAESLINQYGNIFDIYASCPLPDKYKYMRSVNENKEQLLLNVELMDLLTYCEEAIGKQNLVDIAHRMTGVPKVV